mmetsp:Transcript_20087/g.46806  ORF Transcript_20087/g.46806 Transcript_20087/m.46806 type:complete len:361 (-) Transcript_20087:32-1114(-)
MLGHVQRPLRQHWRARSSRSRVVCHVVIIVGLTVLFSGRSCFVELTNVQGKHQTSDCGACCSRESAAGVSRPVGALTQDDLSIAALNVTDADRSCIVAASSVEAAGQLSSPEVIACIIPPTQADTDLAADWKVQIPSFPLFDIIAELDVSPGADVGGALRSAIMPSLPFYLQDDTRIDGQIIQRTLDRLERLVGDVQTASATSANIRNRVQVRIESVDSVRCPRFHLDNVPLRGFVVMTGETTEVLPESTVCRKGFGLKPKEKLAFSTEEWNRMVASGHSPEGLLRRPPVAGTLLMKGTKWMDADGRLHVAAVHRSPPGGGHRILLSADMQPVESTSPAGWVVAIATASVFLVALAVSFR